MTESVRTGILAAAGLMLVLGAGACSHSTSSSQSGSTGRQAAAQAVCHTAIQHQLKPSATVQFSQEEAKVTNYGFKITGMVEEQISGATAKKHYICSADENGSGNWLAEGVSVSQG